MIAPLPTKPLTSARAAPGGVELTSGTVGMSARIRSWAFSHSCWAVASSVAARASDIVLSSSSFLYANSVDGLPST